ncbi:MAG: radical SAM protein [bacterium]
MKIIFVEMSCSLKKGFKEDHDSYIISEPLALEYLSAIAEKQGHTTLVLQQANKSFATMLLEINTFAPEILCCSCWSANFNQTIEMLNEIKKINPRIITIIGGIHVTTDPNAIAHKCVDIAVKGEGEATFAELLDRIENHKPLERCKGIFHKVGNQIFEEENRERIMNIDSISFPDRKHTNFSQYAVHALNYPPSNKQRSALVFGSRGCKYNCEFCTNRVSWSNKVTYRTPDNIIDEIRILKIKYNVNHIQFADECLTSNKEWLYELCDKIHFHSLQTPITIFGRVNEVDNEMLIYLKKAGVVAISYGVESLDSNILKTMRKGINLNHIRKAFETTINNGILSSCLLMVGYANEEMEVLDAINRELPTIPFTRFTLSFTYPFLGTRLRKRVDEENLWLAEKYKNPSYATIECQVLKTKHYTDLNKFAKDLYYRIYSSENYQETVKKILKINPILKESFIYFFSILEKEFNLELQKHIE